MIAPLGAGAEGSWFAFPHRIAASLDKEALKDYARSQLYQVFRVEPTQPLADDPEPVPVLRVRGTGHTEMPLYPSLKMLRQAILDTYAGMPVEELDTKITQSNQPPDGHEAIAEKPYVALQRGRDAWGASRDNANINSYPNFKLRNGVDEFAIVYGANHQATGKAAYASFTPYVDKDRWLGLPDGTITSNNYDADGQPGGGEAAGQRHAGQPGEVAADGEDVGEVHGQRVAGLLAQAEGGGRRGGRDHQVDLLEGAGEVARDQRPDLLRLFAPVHPAARATASSAYWRR